MEEPFSRLNSIVTRLANVLKCQKCSVLKEEDSMVFFHLCDHFYCLDCLENQIMCLACENQLDKPIKIKDDKNILSLYRSFLKFELPSKEEIAIIYKEYKESKEFREQNLEKEGLQNENEIILSNSNTDCNEESKRNEQIDFSPAGSEEKIAFECSGDTTNNFSNTKRRKLNKKKTTCLLNDGFQSISDFKTDCNEESKKNEQLDFSPAGSEEKVASKNNSDKTNNDASSTEKQLRSRTKNTNTTDNDYKNIDEKTSITQTPRFTRVSRKNGCQSTDEKVSSTQTPKFTRVTEENDCQNTSNEKRSSAQTPKPSRTNKRKIALDVSPVSVDNISNSTCTSKSKLNASTSKININKRNPKGETQLHIACKKSNFSLMKDLIDAGANLNAKDNAGWTPLHDSVFTGNIEVVKFLLDNGAKINVPGLENTTALHEAIAKENPKLVKLLVDYGADIHAMNIFRETPLDLVTKYNFTELKEILSEAANSSTKDNLSVELEESEELLGTKALYKHNLNIDDEELVNQFAKKFNWDLISYTTSKSSPTHIVVPGEKLEITWKLISFVPCGCWITTIDWIKESLKENSPIPLDLYKPSTKLREGFEKARSNKLNQLPGLFSGCHFFFGGNFKLYEFQNISIEKESLKCLVERNEGIIVKRCPDPESLALEKTVPFHANSLGSLRETSYFIIYQSEKWDPKPKYNMPHMKTLPVDWLVACISKFELIDPKDFERLEF